MKKYLTYKSLLVIAVVCLAVSVLVDLGIAEFVIKGVGLVALAWAGFEYFGHHKIVIGKETK